MTPAATDQTRNKARGRLAKPSSRTTEPARGGTASRSRKAVPVAGNLGDDGYADELASGLHAVIVPLRRVLRRAVRRRAPVPPLPTAQIELLRVVEERPGIGVREAAAALQLAANSVSTLVNQLVLGGLLERTRDEGDRRNAHLWLTPSASARFEMWRDQRLEVLRSALGDLSPEEAERVRAALPALQRMMASIEAMG